MSLRQKSSSDTGVAFCKSHSERIYLQKSAKMKHTAGRCIYASLQHQDSTTYSCSGSSGRGVRLATSVRRAGSYDRKAEIAVAVQKIGGAIGVQMAFENLGRSPTVDRNGTKGRFFRVAEWKLELSSDAA
nr:hypothetical protein CFP56_11355 [Quercus suber]